MLPYCGLLPLGPGNGEGGGEEEGISPSSSSAMPFGRKYDKSSMLQQRLKEVPQCTQCQWVQNVRKARRIEGATRRRAKCYCSCSTTHGKKGLTLKFSMFVCVCERCMMGCRWPPAGEVEAQQTNNHRWA